MSVHKVSVWFRMFESKAFDELKTKEFTCVNDCFQFESNAAIGHYGQTLINLHIEKLPEGYYLATSEDVQGLIAQGRTITETIEIARDVAKKLIEAQADKDLKKYRTFANRFDYPLVVGI